MAQEIGVAYVALLPTAKGFGRAVEGEIDSAVGAGEKKASGFFGKVAKGASLAVAGAVAAVGAITLGKGISRALNIEDAQAKLKGLGNDAASVEAIMSSALASVKGTAFGLDTAATVAATAVAAGIKPGQELEKYLSLTADAATIAGVSLEEMGSILNKTTTSGKVYTQELNQLADRGLPVFQWLQDEYGVTAEELRKMVERGEVDAATFRKVIEENIGGAALASGDTTRGAFANLGSALGRLGAIFAGPSLGLAKTIFQEMTEVIDAVTAKLQPLAGAFGSFVEGIDLSQVGEQFTAFLGNLDVGALIAAVGNGRAAMVDAGVSLLSGLLDGAINALPQIINAIVGGIGQIVGIIATQGPALLTAAATLFLGLVNGLVTVLPSLLSTVLGLVPQIISALITLLPSLIQGAVTLFLGLVQGVYEVLPQLIVMITELVPQIATALVTMIPQLIQGAITLFMGIIEAWPQIIPPLLTAIADLLPTLLTAIVSLIPALLNGAIQLFLAIVEALPIIIPALIDAVIGLLPVLITTIIGLIPMLIETAIKLFTSLVEAIPVIIPKLIDAVITIGPKLVDAVIKMVPLLLNAGKDLIRGLGEGIASMGQWIMDQIGNVVGGAIDWAKSLLGIASPSKVFFEIGAFTGEGLADGIAAQAPGVRAAVDHMIHIPDAATVGSSTRGSDIYVQNPFTGEYLLARIENVASGQTQTKLSNMAHAVNGGVL
jgi:tape measure domain-containing protein